MADESADDEVPEGAAVFPLIPEELGVHPLLLAVLHATVFLTGSDEDVIHPAAADEAVDVMAQYLQRLEGLDRERVRGDLECLIGYANLEKWPKQELAFLKAMRSDLDESEEEAS